MITVYWCLLLVFSFRVYTTLFFILDTLQYMCSQIRILFESALFEPRAFAPVCTSVEAIPLDRSHPDAAQRALGSPLGVLPFELQHHPDSVMLPLLTLVRDAANLCIGRTRRASSCCIAWFGLEQWFGVNA